MDHNQKLQELRHSAAHLLAHAIFELYPDAQPTIGPATETGFFYDFLPGSSNFKEEDLARLEERMHEIAKKNYPIVGKQVSKEEARALYKNNPFKLEIIDSIPEPTVGIYTQGNFFDLCRGGHVHSLGEIKYFKLTAISGAYWRGNREGVALQRISGVAFLTQKDLDDYLKRLEEAKMYDHRLLGKQLDLFSFHEEAPGSVFFHPKGVALYNALLDYSRTMQKSDYQEIRTPIIMNEQLWKQSGHYDNYKENMYFTKVEDHTYCVRPMNCPSAMMVYSERPRSYRELPLRLSEYGLVHRYELSGVLHGLFRVRSFTQDDAHIFVTLDQIEQEVIKGIELAEKMYAKFDFHDLEIALSTRPEKSIGSDEWWEKATSALENALKKKGYTYEIQEGDGAFYGPKIEIKVKDTMGRKWTCGTFQIDPFLPQKFELDYVDSDQSRKTPIVVHRAIYGSIERFLGIILEHYKGRLPLWLAPVQVRLLPISDAVRDYAANIEKELRSVSVRVELDQSGDQLGAQIRRAQSDKIPLMAIIGKKEMETKTVTLRDLDGKQETVSVSELVERCRNK